MVPAEGYGGRSSDPNESRSDEEVNTELGEGGIYPQPAERGESRRNCGIAGHVPRSGSLGVLTRPSLMKTVLSSNVPQPCL